FSLGIGEEAETANSIASADEKAARLVADVFLEAVNSRNANAANSVGTKDFQEKDEGKKAINMFNSTRFRGSIGDYTWPRLTRLDGGPGEDAFVGGGELQRRTVARFDSMYILRIVKEDGKWRVASFTADER